jgi:DNA-binding transcriptional LysR family regulator
MSTPEQQESLRTGRINAGLLQTPLDDPIILTERIMTLVNIAVVPQSHPLAGCRRLRIADFADVPLIVPPRQVAPSMYDEFGVACADAGFQPLFVAEASPAQSIIALAAAGIGIGLIASPFRRFTRSGVVFREIDGDVPCIDLAIAVRADDRSSITATLLSIARQKERFADL